MRICSDCYQIVISWIPRKWVVEFVNETHQCPICKGWLTGFYEFTVTMEKFIDIFQFVRVLRGP